MLNYNKDLLKHLTTTTKTPFDHHKTHRRQTDQGLIPRRDRAKIMTLCETFLTLKDTTQPQTDRQTALDDIYDQLLNVCIIQGVH